MELCIYIQLYNISKNSSSSSAFFPISFFFFFSFLSRQTLLFYVYPRLHANEIIWGLAIPLKNHLNWKWSQTTNLGKPVQTGVPVCTGFPKFTQTTQDDESKLRQTSIHWFLSMWTEQYRLVSWSGDWDSHHLRPPASCCWTVYPNWLSLELE